MSRRTAAAAAATKLQQISAAADDSDSEMGFEDSENALSEDEASDYESGPKASKKGEPPNKRARSSVTSPLKQAAAPTKRGKKSLSLLPTMPLDVLFEILGQLAPKDLLNVSRINKLFRETLLANSAKSVWKNALKGAGAPECPSDITEPRWARLLFLTSCESCGAKNIQKVDFFLRRRVCTACKKKNLLVKSKVKAVFPDCDDLTLSLISSTNVGGWAHGHSSSSKFYWKSDIEEMIHTLATYKQKKHMRIPGAQNDLATFMAQRMVLVEETQSNGKKFENWYSDVTTGRQNENEQSTKRRQAAIREKFLELGYEVADLGYLWQEKAYNQKALLTDSIWKRIRPILEPSVQAMKNLRLAKEMRRTTNIRRNLLNEFCTHYKRNISPPLWKYVPNVIEIGAKEPFKALLEAGPDVELTIDDFMPLMPKLPEVITEIQDELKALLVQKLKALLKPGQVLPANCLDLATSVFFCDDGTNACRSQGYVAGTESILSHNCGIDVYPTSSRPWATVSSDYHTRTFVEHYAARLTARALVRCAGLDPEKALASEMDRKDLRFACNLCVNRRPVGFSWRTALSHTRVHSADLPADMANMWRVLSPSEAAFLRESERKDPKWSAANWSCSRCPVALRDAGVHPDDDVVLHVHMYSAFPETGMHREAVVEHVQTVHNIAAPTEPTDLFYFEKVVTPFRQPDAIIYEPPTVETNNTVCLMCASSGSQAARNRLFYKQGVVAHLKDKHSIKVPVEGTHWGRR